MHALPCKGTAYNRSATRTQAKLSNVHLAAHSRGLGLAVGIAVREETTVRLQIAVSVCNYHRVKHTAQELPPHPHPQLAAAAAAMSKRCAIKAK